MAMRESLDTLKDFILEEKLTQGKWSQKAENIEKAQCG